MTKPRGFPYRQAIAIVRPELAAKLIGEGTAPTLFDPDAAPQEQVINRAFDPQEPVGRAVAFGPPAAVRPLFLSGLAGAGAASPNSRRTSASEQASPHGRPCRPQPHTSPTRARVAACREGTGSEGPSGKCHSDQKAECCRGASRMEPVGWLRSGNEAGVMRAP